MLFFDATDASQCYFSMNNCTKICGKRKICGSTT